jgi:hypothetical protein
VGVVDPGASAMIATRHVLGATMLVCLWLTLWLVQGRDIGWRATLTIWGWVLGVVGWLALAAWLLR